MTDTRAIGWLTWTSPTTILDVALEEGPSGKR
jgi:hypothetical protein